MTRENFWKSQCKQIASSMQSWLPPIPFESATKQPKSRFWPRLYLRLRKLAAEEKEVVLKYYKYWSAAEELPKLRVALTGMVDTSRPIEIGCTKIGGKPHMPKDLEWPGHMAFLAQYNLEEIEGMLCSSLLPTSGMLYFFGGFEDSYEEAKVLHHPCTKEEKMQKDHLKIREPEAKDEDEIEDDYILKHPEEACLRLEEHIVANTRWLHQLTLTKEEYDVIEKSSFIQNCEATLAFGVPSDSGGMLGEDLDDFLLFQVNDVSIQGNGYVWFQIKSDDLATRRWEKISYVTYAD